ncbi:MAG: PHB depolymerase family esterase [Gaiellaceae bacterium]
MKPLPVSIAVCAALALSSGAGAAPRAAGASTGGGLVPYGAPIKPAVEATGTVVKGSLRTPDGRRRTYRLYVPRSLSRKKHVPLLVALHGRGGSAKNFENNSGFDGLAEANRFLIVYPDGTWSSDEAGGRVWNAGGCCGSAQQKLDNVNDVRFVSLLIDEVESEYNVNQKRVFAAGHSNGAMMGLRLACQLSNKVVAVAVQSGTLFVNKCRYRKPGAVLEIHGSADSFVPIDGGVGSMDPSGVDFPPPRQGLKKLAASNGCRRGTLTSTDADDPDLSYEIWRHCKAGAIVEWVKVEGAGHAWMPSSSSSFDSSAAAWSFLSAHPRP